MIIPSLTARLDGMDLITRVWIDEGCIACGMCSSICPLVFDIPDDEAVIRAVVRSDGMTSPNRQERSLLSNLGSGDSAVIIEAAARCPVEIIKFDAVT